MRPRGRAIQVLAGILSVGTLAALLANAPKSVVPAGDDEVGIRTLVPEEKRKPFLRPRQGEPWLGISVRKRGAQAQAADAEAIPPGVGFILHDVVKDGPADQAGLEKGDVIWKLNDQLLVNEAQFLVLLNHFDVGESVGLTCRREDEPLEVRVALGARPANENGRQQAEVLVKADSTPAGLPPEFVEFLRQELSIEGPEGVKVVLSRTGDKFHWQQLDREGVVIQEGNLKDADDIRFPAGSNVELSKHLRLLIRAYEDSQKRLRMGQRSARVRRLPVPAP